MRRYKLETEEELLQLQSDFRQRTLKDRINRVRKRKVKNKICKLRLWLKDHLN